MDNRAMSMFLFTMVKETERSFERPVILFTQKDYADDIFMSLATMRQALADNAPSEKIFEIVKSFHNKWLEAVQDVEKFLKRVKETPRDTILQAIDFTTQCTRLRYDYLRRYMDKMSYVMTEDEKKVLQSDVHTIKEMQEIVNSTLQGKKKDIRSQADQSEYLNKIHDEIEELLNWLDRLNDSLSIQYCKVLDLKIPIAPSDLTKTLRQIIDEVAADPTPEAKRVAELITLKDQLLGNMIRISSLNELEIANVVLKIRALEDRISKLQSKNSSALLALRHKTLYLEDRLQSLENIKKSMNTLKTESSNIQREASQSPHNLRDVRIFNHLLPHHDRCRLVEQLVALWNGAIVEHDHESIISSIISILSAANLKEVFSDEKGNFTVDVHGRKIYTNEEDETLYQLNEKNELVPLKDDDKHVYFYDECGRYYINEVRERVYKDHDHASEYILCKRGYLVKVLKEVNGVNYYYDWLGRYYINDIGEHIYCEENSTTEYVHDGLGNLVKIHSQTFYYDPHFREPMTMEESKYLKFVVGEALKKCITDVVTRQPNDPVGFLADRLVKYHKTLLEREKRLKDEKARFEERDLLYPAKENSANRSYTIIGEAYDDYNFINYKHEFEDN